MPRKARMRLFSEKSLGVVNLPSSNCFVGVGPTHQCAFFAKSTLPHSPKPNPASMKQPRDLATGSCLTEQSVCCLQHSDIGKCRPLTLSNPAHYAPGSSYQPSSLFCSLSESSFNLSFSFFALMIDINLDECA